MTHTPEERSSDVVIPLPVKGRVVPFERAQQSELQLAVQQRAQDHIDRERARPKPSATRVAVTIAIAIIPVLVIMGVIDTAMRVFGLFTFKLDEFTSRPRVAAPAPETAEPVPAVEQAPDIIFVVPQEQQPDGVTPPAP